MAERGVDGRVDSSEIEAGVVQNVRSVTVVGTAAVSRPVRHIHTSHTAALECTLEIGS